MKFLLYLSVFLLVGGLICAKTKPDKSDHIKCLSVVVADEVKSGDFLIDIKDDKIRELATDPAFVRVLLDRMLTVQSYGVFTIGKVLWMDKEYVVSFGICGKVFTYADARVAKDFIESLADVDIEKILK